MRNNMIEVLIGISGSGKSTYANRKRDDYGMQGQKCVIINRDKIREQLFGFSEESICDYYKRPDIGKNEVIVTDFETAAIRHALTNGYYVIVDNTHTQLKYINRYKQFGVDIKFTLFDICVDTAVKRQKNRARKVSREVIQKQYDSLQQLKKEFDFQPFIVNLPPLYNNPFKKRCYVFDIDGTLAHHFDRSPYEWSKVDTDHIDISIANVLRQLSKESDIIICTGRDGCCEQETKNWLFGNDIQFNKFYIRENNDNRPDWIVKHEFWADIMKENYISMIYDDRDQVIDHARRVGLKVAQVAYGNF